MFVADGVIGSGPRPGTYPYRHANTPTYASLRSTISNTFDNGAADPAIKSSIANTSWPSWRRTRIAATRCSFKSSYDDETKIRMSQPLFFKKYYAIELANIHARLLQSHLSGLALSLAHE